MKPFIMHLKSHKVMQRIKLKTGKYATLLICRSSVYKELFLDFILHTGKT